MELILDQAQLCLVGISLFVSFTLLGLLLLLLLLFFFFFFFFFFGFIYLVIIWVIFANMTAMIMR
jgi:hypothetical protein